MNAQKRRKYSFSLPWKLQEGGSVRADPVRVLIKAERSVKELIPPVLV